MAPAGIPRTQVFISYSHEDSEWLKRLQVHLKSLGREQNIKCWDDTRIQPGEKWYGAIQQALARAKVAVLLVSADFLASDFIAEEELPSLLEAAEHEGALILPLLVSPSRFTRTQLGQFQAANDPERTLEEMGPAERERVLVELSVVIEEAFSKSPAPTLERQEDIPFPRHFFFTGREALLEKVHKALQAGPVALTGLGGIGKTQTAVEYAYRYREDYAAILWLLADSRVSLMKSCMALAAQLNLPQQTLQEEEMVVAAVKRWLQTHDRWLLILDNADDLELAQDFLPPQLPGHVLLTSRATTTGVLAQGLPVDVFLPEVGMEFLLRRAKRLEKTVPLETASEDERKAAKALSEELGGLPLALDQAAAFMEETQVSPTDYLKLYQAEGKKLREERGKLTGDHPSVTVTFSLAFEKVAAAHPAAAELLRLCAFLHPEGIPEEVITQGAPDLGEALEPVVSNRWLETRTEACRYALLDYDTATRALSLHRVVQDVLRDGMEEDTQRRWAERAVRALARGFPEVEFTTWPGCERWLPHVLAGAAWIARWNFGFAEAALLLGQTGYYLHERGRYAEAEPLFQRVLTIREQVLGPDHPDTATSLNNLAGLYWTQGRYEKAEPLFQQALAIDEQALGPDHPDTATSLNNLAALYRAQGRYEKAEPLYQRVLAIFEKTCGPDHPDTARSLDGLAVQHWAQGRYEKAESLLQRALAIYEKTLGPDHPDAAISLNNLAALYQAQGRYEKAEPLYQRALAIREQALGPEHPDTAISLNNLARVYQNQGRYSDAEPLLQRALAIIEKTLGPDHHDTHIVRQNYQTFLEAMRQ